jgi:hypothetical protein
MTTTPNLRFHDLVVYAMAAVAILLAAASTASAVPANNESLQPGYILVISVVGEPKIITPENPAGSVIVKGSNLRAGDMVVTGSGDLVGLAFSNGSLFEVAENSKFSVQEYLQEPWNFSPEEWKTLEAEPTSSVTKAYLDYGEVVVKVKKLDGNSSMQVSTPLGVAGIRGTTFRVRVVRSPDGTPRSASVQVVEGRVNFSPQGAAEPADVAAGNSVTVSVTVGPEGRLEVIPPAREVLSAQDIELIQATIQRLIEGNNQVVTLGDTPSQTPPGAEEEPPRPGEENRQPIVLPPSTPTPTPAPTNPTPTPAPTPAPTAPTPTPVPSLL